MDCLSNNTLEGSNMKKVRFVSPLLSHRQVSLLSPPPTPMLSPVLTPPQSPLLNRNTVNRKSLIDNNFSVQQRHLIPSRSLTNSPKRVLKKEKLPEQLTQKSLALKLVQTLIKHSQSSDSLQLSPKMSKKQSKSNRSKQLLLPTSFSLNSISSSSNSAIYQLIRREERQRCFDEFHSKLQGNHRSSSSSCPPPIAVSFTSKHRCCFRPEGVVLGHNSFGPLLSNSSQTSSNSFHLANINTTTTSTFQGITGSSTSSGSCDGGGGVNICCRASSVVLEETKKKNEKKRPPLLCHHFHKPPFFESQKFSSLFQSSQKRIFCWPPPFTAGQLISSKKRLPNSYTFPPPLIMNASPSHQQQQTFNELEDFDEDFVPRSSNVARENNNNKNPMETHIEEKTQIRRMSLKEFSGLDLLEEHANQKAASNLSPMLHPWRSGQQLTLGSLIDKFSNRRRSSSSGGAKIESGGIQHSHSEDGYNSFDRALDGINQAIRETIASENNEKNSSSNGIMEKNGNQNNNIHHLERQYSSSTGRNTFGQTLQRLTNIRNHLNSTLQSVPNASPRKATSSEPDCEKLVLLNECKLLIIACKNMIRNANSTSPPSSQTSDLSLLQTCSSTDLHIIIQTVVDSVERAIDSVEMLIRKSNSIFQAQQLTSNADQLLKALAETIREVEKCQKPIKSNEQVKQLTRLSTVLTANLISFTELIRNI